MLYSKEQVQKRIVLLIAVISAALLGWLLLYSEDADIFLACDTIEDKIERYVCYKDAALSAIQHGKSVEELFGFIVESPGTRHLKEHAVGRAALIVSNYNLYEAKNMCRQNCTGAYYHAMAEEWGEYAPRQLDELVAFLESFCKFEEPGGEECYHHVGHFYMSSNKNFKESMSYCDNTLENDARFSECVYGVVHEQLIQSGAENFFELCLGLSGRARRVCYTRGSLTYPKWLDDKLKMYKNPLEICHVLNAKIPLEFNHCYASAAWVLQNIGKTPDPAWCKETNVPLRELCIKGLELPEPYWGDSASCGVETDEGEASACGLQI